MCVLLPSLFSFIWMQMKTPKTIVRVTVAKKHARRHTEIKTPEMNSPHEHIWHTLWCINCNPVDCLERTACELGRSQREHTVLPTVRLNIEQKGLFIPTLCWEKSEGSLGKTEGHIDFLFHPGHNKLQNTDSSKLARWYMYTVFTPLSTHLYSQVIIKLDLTSL